MSESIGAVRLAKRLDGVSESATLKLNALVQSMKAQGVDIANLTAGEPDFNVPDEAKIAVEQALRANRSKYTPAAGIPELRSLIAEKTNHQQPTAIGASRPWKAGDVVVTNGGKQAIFNSLMALLDPGEEVIIPSPYWLSYPEMAKINGGACRYVEAPFSQGFKILPEQLRAALTPKTRAILFNSPSNPTGAMYSREEFAALGRVIRESSAAKDAWVISDEIYDRVAFADFPFCSFLEANPGLRDRVITVNGMSKSAAMTGWRVGWSVAPEGITQALVTIQGQTTSGINALAQWASVAALKMPESMFAAQVERYKARRDLALEILKEAGKLEVRAPEGAFYLFVGVREYLKPGEDSMGFAERLLERGRVAVVPGTPFGKPDFIRLSFATDEKSLETGCRRIVEFLK